MTMHTTATQLSNHSIPGFGLRSMLLAAALAAGAAGAVRAQTSAPSPASPNSPPSQVAPQATGSAGAVPQNRATTQDVEAAFNRADANRDGKLDRQEAEHFPAVAQRFEQIDANRDTFISLAELAKAASGS